MQYEWVNSDGEVIDVRRFYAMFAWFLWPFIAMACGCQPVDKSAETEAPKPLWVINQVHQPAPVVEPAKPVDPLAVPIADESPSQGGLNLVRKKTDPKQHPRYDKSRGVILPEGFKKTEYEFREAQPHPNQSYERRGLFRRWRGGSMSTNAAAGIC